MKRVLLLIAIFFTVLISNAQVVINEDFAGSFPPSGWSIDAHAGNWSSQTSANAGGTAPEANFYYYPNFVGISRLISPSVDLTGHSTVLVQFNHFVDHYSGPYKIGIATRSNGGEWLTSWELSLNSSVPATEVMVTLNDVNTGALNFQFCIYFSGDSYNLNSWSIDNIRLIIPAATDLAVAGTSVPTYLISDYVTANISNIGLADISSFKVNWQLDESDVHTFDVTGVNLALGDGYTYVSNEVLTPESGLHNLKIWISNVNGNVNPDDNPDNDIYVKVLSVPSETVQKVPFFEEFTSSTCGPCANFNNSTFNPFLETNGDQLVFVKYQMNWPGSGDPYYTQEGGVRSAYYSVGAVPMLYVEGKNVSTSGSAVNSAFNGSLNTPAFIDFSSNFAILDENNLLIRGQFKSYAHLYNTTLHIVVFENVTTGNVGSNGETEFHHVMMKMVPGASGQLYAEIPAGEVQTFEHTVDMSSTFVEDMEDLSVALFLQDPDTKEVFQAAYAYKSAVGVKDIQPEMLSIYPNPVSDQLNILIPETAGKEVKIEILNSLGTVVKSVTLKGTSTYSLKNDLGKGIYTVRVIGEGQLFTGKFISSK